MNLATVILWAAAIYTLAGLLFAIGFVTFGAAAVDDAARHAPISFRVAIFPGAVALWPILLFKWPLGSAIRSVGL